MPSPDPSCNFGTAFKAVLWGNWDGLGWANCTPVPLPLFNLQSLARRGSEKARTVCLGGGGSLADSLV